MDIIDKNKNIENPDAVLIEQSVSKDEKEVLAIKENLEKSLKATADPKEADLIRQRLARLDNIKISPETKLEGSDSLSPESVVAGLQVLQALNEAQAYDSKTQSATTADELVRKAMDLK